jgi:hypothetical protein
LHRASAVSVRPPGRNNPPGDCRWRRTSGQCDALAMRERITQRQAAEILGCHVSLVGKLVARGALTSRGGKGSLDRAQVVKLARDRVKATAAAQAAGAAARESQRRKVTANATRPEAPMVDHSRGGRVHGRLATGDLTASPKGPPAVRRARGPAVVQTRSLGVGTARGLGEAAPRSTLSDACRCLRCLRRRRRRFIPRGSRPRCRSGRSHACTTKPAKMASSTTRRAPTPTTVGLLSRENVEAVVTFEHAAARSGTRARGSRPARA